MARILDPAALSPEDTIQLYEFFNTQAAMGARIWKKGTTYSFADKTQFEFSHDVVQRQRKDGKSGVRYEFISDKLLGKGAFGSVYEVAGTLTLEEGNVTFKQAGYNNKTRAVKIQKHTQLVREEYAISKKVKHLAVKEPTVFGTDSYTVMRKVSGSPLIDILIADLGGTKPLTLKQRISISKALLIALKEQVTDQGIIHRDIKPANLLIDLNEPITVNIIDFGFGIEERVGARRNYGTPGYVAPEILGSAQPSVKVDVFSMARVIALLWHVDIKSYNLDTMNTSKYNANNVDLSSLFTGLPEVRVEDRYLIRNTLKQMVQPEPNQRLSITEAISAFDQLDPQQSVTSSPHNFSLDLRALAATLGLESRAKSTVVATAIPESKKRIQHILEQTQLLWNKVADLRARQENDVADKLECLTHDIETKLLHLKRISDTDYSQQVLSVINDSHQLISANKELFQQHRDLNYIWANIALAIAGLGLIYLAASLVNHHCNNSFLFFSKTKTTNLVEDVENELNKIVAEKLDLPSPPAGTNNK